jgi:hypothetical protein
MAGSDEDRGRSRRLGAEDRGWSSTGRVLGGRTIERSGDAVCGLHRAQEDEECGFLGLASKPRSTISLVLTSKPVVTVFVLWPQNHSLGFSGLGIKTASCGFVIWPTKSPQRFLGLGLKTKWAMVCRLRLKTDGRMKTARDTRRDLATSFAWKRVGLGFPSLASRLAEARHGWCTWHHHGGRVEMKSKTDGSMRQATSDSSTPTLPFSLY